MVGTEVWGEEVKDGGILERWVGLNGIGWGSLEFGWVTVSRLGSYWCSIPRASIIEGLTIWCYLGDSQEIICLVREYGTAEEQCFCESIGS